MILTNLFRTQTVQIVLITYLFLFPKAMIAQKTIEATYRLTGVHDMAAEFQFKKDGTFEFYYMYGASDRNATGTYTISNDTIKLKSDKDAGNDFTITHESKKGSKYKIVVKDKNEYLLRNIIAVALIGDSENVFESNGKGEIEIDLKQCDKIYLQHQMFPDILTLIKDSDNTNNYFEITLNPSLQQVSFKSIDFFIDGDELHCHSNYFMPFEDITFVKE